MVSGKRTSCLRGCDSRCGRKIKLLITDRLRHLWPAVIDSRSDYVKKELV